MTFSILRDAKQPGGTYKNIKARVDSGLSKVTTRADARKALSTVTNVHSTGFAKALATQRSAIQSKFFFFLVVFFVRTKTQ